MSTKNQIQYIPSLASNTEVDAAAGPFPLVEAEDGAPPPMAIGKAESI